MKRRERLAAVRRLPHHLKPVLQIENGPQAVAHQGLVFDEEEFDRARHGRRKDFQRMGSFTSTREPLPLLDNVNVPPSPSTRSRIPRNP